MTHTRRNQLVITCEHGGRKLPRAYAGLFAGRKALLDSHHGWDPGALELGRRMADALGAALHAATTTRLLVDLNRSVGHRQMFSPLTRALPPAQRQRIVEQHYRPHRDAVEGVVAGHVAAGQRVIHVASHSFAPTLAGVERRADVAWLYDPRRPGESNFVQSWMRAFAPRAPGLRLRRNDPYRGRSDGLTAWLRKHHPDAAYVGIELELNQRFVLQGGAQWRTLQAALIDALAETLAATTAAPAP